MDSEVIFQLTASIIASIFCGASLAFWLLSIDAMSLQRLSKEPLISSQAVIGGFVFLGSITSVFLALLAADPKYDLSQRMLQLEVDSVLLLLILNEYLSVSTLQHWLAHIVSALLFVGTVAILLFSMAFSEHRRALFSSFMIFAFAGLGFIHAQVIRAWIICMRPWHIETNTFKLFWHYPLLTAARHQRALLDDTCLHTYQPAASNCDVPNRHNRPKKGGRFIMPSSSSTNMKLLPFARTRPKIRTEYKSAFERRRLGNSYNIRSCAMQCKEVLGNWKWRQGWFTTILEIT